MIDIHSHILPGLDDGSKTTEEFRDALIAAKQQSVTEIICTPHFYPPDAHVLVSKEKGQHFCCSKNEILDVLSTVSSLASECGIKLHSGMECFYHSSLLSLIEKGEVLPLAGSRYLLVEFSQDTSFREIKQAVISILDIGYLPVIAHYERYFSLVSGDRLNELRDLGAMIQMNFDTIQRYYGLFRKNPFRQDLRAGLVDLMGSDCHGTHFRSLRIGPSLEWMNKRIKLADRILYENPQKILNDRI